jgi:hypothetical protein
MKTSIFILENRIKNNAVTRWMRLLLFYYPLTVSGSLLLILSLILLGRSYAKSNPYGILLSLFAVIVLLFLSTAGRLQALKLRDALPQWESSQALIAESEKTYHLFHADRIKTLFFYRLHVKVSGRMRIGNGAGIYISSEVNSTGKDIIKVPMFFPVAGEFNANSSLKVRDIFGLTRARFGTDQERKLIIQPAVFTSGTNYRFEAVGGFEEKNRQKSSDEERYYMREYIPGDRFRDINWKSSSRLSELITKISPYTQEKTKTILIDFRHYKRTSRESPESIAHLNLLKSWLLYFLRQVKNENSGYIFRVKTGKDIVDLETSEDIDHFSVDLSSLFFQAEPSYNQAESGIGDIFIFSTPYDLNIHSVIAGYQRANICVFRTVTEKKLPRNNVHRNMPPGKRISGSADPDSYKKSSGKTFHMLKSSSKTPGSIPIPDTWIFFREMNAKEKNVSLPQGGRLEEYPVSVKIF